MIRLGRLPAVGLGIGRETQRHGLDVGLFGRRSAAREIDGLLNGVVRFGETLVAGGIVVVRPYGFRHSPIGHGEFGIEIGGALE